MKHLRVLIIEDDALVVLLLTELLAEMGHEVCATANNETAAIDAALREEPDLVIADARLTSGSGISAVEEILERGHIPHLFVTGDTTDVAARRPAAIVVRKPFREAALAKAIESALRAAAAL